MSALLTLELEQLKSLVKQCAPEEKIELIKLLEEDTFKLRFQNLLEKTWTDEFSLEEITREVETVRENRYKAKNVN